MNVETVGVGVIQFDEDMRALCIVVQRRNEVTHFEVEASSLMQLDFRTAALHSHGHTACCDT